LEGIAELETDSTAILLKHNTSPIDARDARNARTMSYLSKKPAVIVNTYIGQASTVSQDNCDDRYMGLLARAVLANKQARTAKMFLQGRRLATPVKEDLMVAFDVEYIKEERQSIVAEIGAVAFTKSGVVAVFQELAPGVSPGFGYMQPMVSKLCNLNLDALTRQGGGVLVNNFYAWLMSMGPCELIQWAGSDFSLVGLSDSQYVSHDALNYFRAWLDRGHESRSNNLTLSDAVTQLLGEQAFEPHRAFEDAVATMVVVQSIF
jgi:hypothetical protein